MVLLSEHIQRLHEAVPFIPASPLLLLFILASALLALWLVWPLLGGWLPRLTAFISPFLPIGLLLLATGTAAFLLIERSIHFLWESPALWTALRRLPLVEAFDWLWPWLPTVLAFFLLLLAGAVSLSRRSFHLVTLLVLLSVTLGVVLHEEPRRFEPSGPEARMTSEIATERLADRIFAPLFHVPDAKPDAVTVGAFGLVLLLGFSWLDRLNLRRSLRPIRVASIRDARGQGEPRERPDLEQLMREHLHRNMPHTPPWLPGGTLQYWQDFVEKQATKDDHWLVRAATVVLRVIQPPSGLEITGTLVQEEELGLPPEERGKAKSPPSPRNRCGIMVHMVDLRTRQTLMARTIWNEECIENAVEQAAYAAVERAFRECKTLPEWVHWEEDDGAALRMYHQGVRELTMGACGQQSTQKARRLLLEAAKRSPGSALARLQLAEAREACGDYVGAIELYLNVASRYPRLLVAKYRLASTCRAFRRWGQKMMDEQSTQVPKPEPRPEGRLASVREALRRWSQKLRNEPKKTRPGPEVQKPRERLLQALSSPYARKLWKPSWTSLCCRRARAELDIHCQDNLHTALLNMAHRALRQQGSVLRLLHWCLNATDRRLFWHTRLWPPRRQQDLRLATRSALRCVEWHRIQHQRTLHQRSEKRFSYQTPCLYGRRMWTRVLARRLSREVNQASRIPRNWLGAANFNLACFYALCMEAEQRELLSRLSKLWNETDSERRALPLADEPLACAYTRALTATQSIRQTEKGPFNERRKEEVSALKTLMDTATRLVWTYRKEMPWGLRRKLRQQVLAIETPLPTPPPAWVDLPKGSRKELKALAHHVVKSHKHVQDAIEHLTCSLRDPEGPFSSKTWHWLIRHPDLDALGQQPRFQAWQQIIRPEGETLPARAKVKARKRPGTSARTPWPERPEGTAPATG
ncbi:tetratricopeptide repeat protein [Archangium lansingense]|uniref:tetratricopeptide repeat protein n=1 Tax=Archangium lansingense TaxID=2995310 RepID=UPI003B8076FE